ncbi:MAG: 30S ribosomal protein S4e [Euryarchaeota archaeon]|nr:30S ribosomal protein S4e [Euryarchaeota archaeon]
MSNEINRLTAPRSWPIRRKAHQWITKPSPGAHSIDNSVPVTVVVRDLLKICNTAAEVKRIVSNRDMLVDGKIVRDTRKGIGLMDVVSFPKNNSYYRMMVNTRGKFSLVPISEEKSSWKLCRIDNKTIVSGGRTQLNLHDGRNIITDSNEYNTGDVLKIEIPSQNILEVYKMEQGNLALITSGSNVGKVEAIDEIIFRRSSSDNIVNFENGSSTTKSNVFVIGNKVPEIELPEEATI